MNKITKTLLLTVVLMAAVSIVKAQNAPNAKAITGPVIKDPKTPTEVRAKALTDTMNNVLGLAPEQYAKIYEANLTYLTKKAAFKENKSTDVNAETAKEQRQSIAWERKSQIASVLTPNQAEKWKEWKSGRKQAKMEQFQRMKENGKLPNDRPQKANMPAGERMDDIDGM